MPADPVQASLPSAAAGQVFSGAQPQGKSVPGGAPAPAKGQPNTDYAELSPQPPSPSSKQSPSSQDVLAYHVDDQTKQVYFQVVNPQSGQVISQVPPQSILNEDALITQDLDSQSASPNAPAVKGKG
jgi:hypothetical protein